MDFARVVSIITDRYEKRREEKDGRRETYGKH
jgi:hypothetical protein